MIWSPEFYGVTHCENGECRASLSINGCFVKILLWYPGCGFNPIEKIVFDVEEAKQIAENWLEGMA